MLTGFWLLLAWLWPLLLAGPALTRRLWWLPPLGALPALLIGFGVPLGSRVELPWLLLGTRLGLDATGRVFLIFTAMVWLAAGVFAAAQRWRALGEPEQDYRGARFSALFLVAMAGNFWLILGLDLISFYVGFAIMGLASYVLVIHEGNLTALRAGRVYLAMALVGEVALFAALAMIAAETGTTAPEGEQLAGLSQVAIALALIGLGVKAGIFPLHLWLPLAHPAAPIPASAVLSGTMIKVALLGWLRFLPVGVLALPHWGLALILLGLFTLFYGLGIGLTQREAKTILAYSSIGKMGFLLVLLGLVLMQPALAPIGVAAIALYAAHHGLVKAGLFLGVGLRKHADAMRQPLILGGLGFLALAMVGAPLTTGAVAKDATKPLLAALPASWGALWTQLASTGGSAVEGAAGSSPGSTLGADATGPLVETAANSVWWTWLIPDPALVLGLILVLSTMVTVALMARLLWIAQGITIGQGAKPLAGEAGAEIAWALLIQTIIILPFALAQPAALLANGVPVALGFALVAGFLWRLRRGRSRLTEAVGRVPPGDLLELLAPFYRIAWLLGALSWSRWQALMTASGAWASRMLRPRCARAPEDQERELRSWPVAGALWLMVGGVLLIALLTTQSPWVAPMGRPVAAVQPTTAIATAGPEPRPLAMRPLNGQGTRVIPADPWITPRAGPGDPGGKIAEPDHSPRDSGSSIKMESDDALGGALVARLGRTDSDTGRGGTGDIGIEERMDGGNQTDGDRQVSPDATAEQGAAGSDQQAESRGPTVAEGPEINASPPRCQDDAPLIFSLAGDPETSLELAQCVADGDGGWRALDEPELTNRLVLILQRNLEWLGYEPGSTDGMIGPSTRDAIRAFQQDQGMRSTGGIGFRLLRAIKAEIDRRQAD